MTPAAEWVARETIRAWPGNPRIHATALLRQSIERYGFLTSLVVDRATRQVVAGHGRLEVLDALKAEGRAAPAGVRTTSSGEWLVPVRWADFATPNDARGFLAVDNRASDDADWDPALLSALLGPSDLALSPPLLGWSDEERQALAILANMVPAEQPPLGPTDLPAPEPQGPIQPRGALLDQFGVAPFSVLDGRLDLWQQRKQAWIAAGCRSELGRGALASGPASLWGPWLRDARFYETKTRTERAIGRALSTEEFIREFWEAPTTGHAAGPSIFDPVLTEILLRWFCPPGGLVLDPFAGGNVRGVVAAKLGYQYVGFDLREEQVTVNHQWAQQLGAPMSRAQWRVGDARTLELGPSERADFVLTCPPYGDLEGYSEDPRDLSRMLYGDLVQAVETTLVRCVASLRLDRFVALVVGEFRHRNGLYAGFVPDVIRAAERAGLHYYNEIIMLTPYGSLPVRAGRAFRKARKIGKTHQNVLIFVHGSEQLATEALGTEPMGVLFGSEFGGPDDHGGDDAGGGADDDAR